MLNTDLDLFVGLETCKAADYICLQQEKELSVHST